MVVNLKVLGKFECQVQRKYVYKVNIFVKNLYKSFFGYQVGYLSFMKRVDIKQRRVEKFNRIE